ncbi:MAG: hypothetical protein LCH37_02565 [Bacteroidetes bacterium]|nr:hypothetical protein [Bacteroidota bacterium]MCK6611906.1 hypothetical protein [Bacteroidia bacterium]
MKYLSALFCLLLLSQVSTNGNIHRGEKFSIVIADPVEVNVNGETLQGKGQTIPMVVGKESPDVILYQDQNMSIVAEYHLSIYSNRRSETKNGGLKLEVDYVLRHGKTKRVTHQQHLFLQTSNRTFKENVKFSVAKGVKPLNINLTYQASLGE